MKKELYLKCILSFVSVLISLALGESILRIYKPVSYVGFEHQPEIYVKDELNGYAYEPDAVGWMHRNFEMDNNVVINSDGFHDIERSPVHHSNAFRIAVVGDSFTASIHVPLSSTWTQVLERKLAETAQLPVEVINLGLDGTGTDVHANILSSYKYLKSIDMVILAFYANDIKDLELKRVYREVYDGYVIPYQDEMQRDKIVHYIDSNKPSDFMRFLYNNSFVCRIIGNQSAHYSLARSNFIEPRQTGIGQLLKYDQSEAKERFESSIDKFVLLAEQEGFDFIVIPIPGRGSPDKSKRILMDNLSSGTLEKLSIGDLVPPINKLLKDRGIDGKELYWEVDGHFNVTGNQIVGNAMSEIINERLPNKVKRMKGNQQ